MVGKSKYNTPGAIRREQGEPFVSFSARQKAAQAAGKKPKARKPRKQVSKATAS